MEKNKTILNNLLDLGGFATINNFYSPEANSVLGSLVQARKAFAELEGLKLITPLSTITNCRNNSQERFYAVTRQGAQRVDRICDYKWKGASKSPYNIMHESMVRDVSLSFLRLFPEYIVDIEYKACFKGLRPDLVVRMKHKRGYNNYIFLVEVERKKTADRIYRGKLLRYEYILSKLNFAKHNLNAPVSVLIVCSNLDYNPFWRPQDYCIRSIRLEILKLQRQLQNLIRLSSELSPTRYRFLPFSDFYRLNEPIWFNTQHKQIPIIK